MANTAKREGQRSRNTAMFDHEAQLQQALMLPAATAGKMASRASDESLKWVDWPEYLTMVSKLREECGGALQPPFAVLYCAS